MLEGITILDMSRMLAGPYGTLLLADMGARVIKIEDPEGGDPTRSIVPPSKSGLSAYFISVNRNKESLTLDLRKKEAQEVFHQLVRRADVVFDNFRPGVLERLGADYPRLQAINPRIVSCSVSAFGATGPDRDGPAFDLTLQALSGAMALNGEPGRPPVRMSVPIGDLAGGTIAALAVTSALVERQRTGKGRRLDISLLDSLVSMLTYVAQYYFVDGQVPEPVGSAHATVVPYQAFKTKDDNIVVAVFTEKIWTSFCKVVGMEELARDPRYDSTVKRCENRATLVPLLESRFAERRAAEWLADLKPAGVPAAPIMRLDEALANPQLEVRGMIRTVSLPDGSRVRTLGDPMGADGGLKREFRAPALGQHTDAILAELGYGEADVEGLRRRGAV